MTTKLIPTVGFSLLLCFSACTVNVGSDGQFRITNEKAQSPAEMLLGTWKVDLKASAGDQAEALRKLDPAEGMNGMFLALVLAEYEFSADKLNIKPEKAILAAIGRDAPSTPYKLNEAGTAITGTEGDDFNMDILELSSNKLILKYKHEGISEMLKQNGIEKLILTR